MLRGSKREVESQSLRALRRGKNADRLMGDPENFMFDIAYRNFLL